VAVVVACAPPIRSTATKSRSEHDAHTRSSTNHGKQEEPGAAGLALLPLALRGDEPGNEILTPMAIVILFGLFSSTLLNMLVVPALFLRFGEPAPSLEFDGSRMEVRNA